MSLSLSYLAFIIWISLYGTFVGGESCVKNKCKNGGYCRHISSGFSSCHCQEFYFGKTCAMNSRNYALHIEMKLRMDIHTIDEVSKLIIDAVNKYCILSSSKCTMDTFLELENRKSIPFGYFWPSQIHFNQKETIFHPGKFIKTKIFILGIAGYNSNQIMNPTLLKQALLSVHNEQWTLVSFDSQKDDGSSLKLSLTEIISIVIFIILAIVTSLAVIYKIRKRRNHRDGTIQVNQEETSSVEDMPSTPPLYDDKRLHPPPYKPWDRMNSVERAAQPPPYESIC